jgi:hypothetical protein
MEEEKKVEATSSDVRVAETQERLNQVRIIFVSRLFLIG